MATTSVLDQLLDPASGWLTAQSAQKLIDWKISDELRARVEELGRKANLGRLSEQENAEYRAYLDDAELISLMQAKARRQFFGKRSS
jgi:hypothetical protein